VSTLCCARAWAVRPEQPEAAGPRETGSRCSMGGLLDTDGPVYATLVDASGSLYIGGDFMVAGAFPHTQKREQQTGTGRVPPIVSMLSKWKHVHLLRLLFTL
jgi:hypothetical protein